MIAKAFRQRNLDAIYVDARQCIVTDGRHGKAVPQDALIEQRLKQHVCACLGRPGLRHGRLDRRNREGSDHDSGRGGSDFTAALVGGGLDAGSIEISTD